tara:strand:- start:955 stop:1077 length:123 start_codon:yes stop_codon:yes gene_type:complete
MVNPDIDREYMLREHGTKGLVTEYPKPKKEKGTKPLSKWR